MTRIASFPIQIARIIVDAIRARLVYVTMGVVITGGWAAAWSRQIEANDARQVIPPIRKAELTEIRQRRNAAVHSARPEPAAATVAQ